ncbi:hypothetical protein PHJA_002491900 [Phtheirospermum japonicum]|uniref:Uncharacterized protein n=1 Tax=Phtheirospermum japonicum TaxID=374723 RepID=A0A830CUE4_9LAMI|nr:hypothetical protein PHJA_002491900 [Phtheirospermum japonicum]
MWSAYEAWRFLPLFPSLLLITFLRINDNGATEPARILLERLFAQTQKLEEQIGKDPRSPHIAEFGINLESDLQIVLASLKQKEEYLQDAEKKILSEYNEINLARKDLERREEEILSARLKQEILEEKLRLANIDLASQAAEIGDLKFRLKESDSKISGLQSALSAKEREIVNMRLELTRKSEKAASVKLELRTKSRLVDEADKIVEKQNIELGRLERDISMKEEELEFSIGLQKSDSEKLKAAEANLEKQTMEWLVAQEELKNLADKANETMEEFGRVRKLLSDVRSELVSCQKALEFSRREMESRDQLLENQLRELEEQRASVSSYLTSLRDAEVEVESERVKLRLAEAKNEELERDLLLEKELVDELQIELDNERSSLERVVQETSALREIIECKTAEYEGSQRLLEGKELELVEARLEIQHLKSERSSLRLIIEEKDLELSDAKAMLEEVNKEITDLKVILFDKEDELIQAMSMLKEKDERVETMRIELSNAELKFSEAETVVEKIVNLTKEIVNDDLSPLEQKNDRWQIKQLEAELKFTRESLREKEMDILAGQKDLVIKDEELRVVLGKLDAREKEITELKDEIMRDKNDLKELYALAQETVSGKSVGDLAIEKLQLEAARLEVEAATDALYKITEMSRELVNKAGSSIGDDYDGDLCEQGGSEARMNMVDGNCSTEVESEVYRLLALTEQLVREAHIAENVKR